MPIGVQRAAVDAALEASRRASARSGSTDGARPRPVPRTLPPSAGASIVTRGAGTVGLGGRRSSRVPGVVEHDRAVLDAACPARSPRRRGRPGTARCRRCRSAATRPCRPGAGRSPRRTTSPATSAATCIRPRDSAAGAGGDERDAGRRCERGIVPSELVDDGRQRRHGDGQRAGRASVAQRRGAGAVDPLEGARSAT